MAEAADSRAVHGHADEGHGATLLGQVCQRPFQGNVCLRLLRCQALRRQQQVRVGNRLAQLLEAGEREGPRYGHGLQRACRGARRGRLPPLRRPPRSCFPGRSAAHGTEILHELGRAFSGVGARRSHSIPQVEPHAGIEIDQKGQALERRHRDQEARQAGQSD